MDESKVAVKETWITLIYRHPFWSVALLVCILYSLGNLVLSGFNVALAYGAMSEPKKTELAKAVEVLKATEEKSHKDFLIQSAKAQGASASTGKKNSENPTSAQTNQISQAQGLPQGVLYAPKDVVDMANGVLENAQNAVVTANAMSLHVNHVVETATHVVILLFSVGGIAFGFFGWHKFEEFKEEQKATLPQLVKKMIEEEARTELATMKAKLQQDLSIMGREELLELRRGNLEKIREAQDDIRSDFKKITDQAVGVVDDYTTRFDKLEAGFKKDKLAILDLMIGVTYANFVHILDIQKKDNKETIPQDESRTKILKVADISLVGALSHEPYQLRIKAHILVWRAFVLKRLSDIAGCYFAIQEAINIYEQEKPASVPHQVYANGACYACIAGFIDKTKEWAERGVKINLSVFNTIENDSDLAALRASEDYQKWLGELKQKYIKSV